MPTSTNVMMKTNIGDFLVFGYGHRGIQVSAGFNDVAPIFVNRIMLRVSAHLNMNEFGQWHEGKHGIYIHRMESHASPPAATFDRVRSTILLAVPDFLEAHSKEIDAWEQAAYRRDTELIRDHVRQAEAELRDSQAKLRTAEAAERAHAAQCAAATGTRYGRASWEHQGSRIDLYFDRENQHGTLTEIAFSVSYGGSVLFPFGRCSVPTTQRMDSRHTLADVLKYIHDNRAQWRWHSEKKTWIDKQVPEMLEFAREGSGRSRSRRRWAS